MVTAGSGAVALAAPHDPRKLEKAYNPDQPRDWHGRFGEGGGNAKPKAKTQVAHDTTRTNDAASDAGGAIADAARAAATLAAPGLVGAEAARRAVQWLNSERKEDEAPPAAPPNPQAPTAAPASPPPEEPEKRKNEPAEPKRTFTVPDREPSIDNPEDYKLGWDPAKNKFVAEEVKTAWRLQEILQQPLERSAIGGDFVAPDGKVYDAVGPVPDERFNMTKFANSIKTHLRKSEMTTVIDLTGMKPDNMRIVDDYISTLPPEHRAKIIKIGF